MAKPASALFRDLGLGALLGRRRPRRAPAQDAMPAVDWEDRLAAMAPLLDLLEEGIMLLGRDRVVRFANAASRALLGADPKGRSLLSLLRQPELLAALAEIEAEGGAARRALEIEGPEGRQVSLLMAPAAPGEGFVLIQRDRSAVRQAASAKSEFIANAGHELQTPLAGLIGGLETLQGPARDDVAARERFLAVMLSEARRMSRLVADLLSLARIELDEYQRPLGRADLNRVIAAVADSFALRAREKDMTLRVEAEAALPPVPGDEDQLVQVLQNLVDNAVKYGEAGSAVTIAAAVIVDGALLARLFPRPAPALALRLAVADRGPGIARRHLPRLTERFYRVDDARSRRLGGTGLGLAIVKHILGRHRGILDIRSTLGEGSEFSVYLPLDPAP